MNKKTISHPQTRCLSLKYSLQVFPLPCNVDIPASIPTCFDEDFLNYSCILHSGSLSNKPEICTIYDVK